MFPHESGRYPYERQRLRPAGADQTGAGDDKRIRREERNRLKRRLAERRLVRKVRSWIPGAGVRPDQPAAERRREILRHQAQRAEQACRRTQHVLERAEVRSLDKRSRLDWTAVNRALETVRKLAARVRDALRYGVDAAERQERQDREDAALRAEWTGQAAMLRVQLRNKLERQREADARASRTRRQSRPESQPATTPAPAVTREPGTDEAAAAAARPATRNQDMAARARQPTAAEGAAESREFADEGREPCTCGRKSHQMGDALAAALGTSGRSRPAGRPTGRRHGAGLSFPAFQEGEIEAT